jgi:hypothetical protein
MAIALYEVMNFQIVSLSCLFNRVRTKYPSRRRIITFCSNASLTPLIGPIHSSIPLRTRHPHVTQIPDETSPQA